MVFDISKVFLLDGELKTVITDVSFPFPARICFNFLLCDSYSLYERKTYIIPLYAEYGSGYSKAFISELYKLDAKCVIAFHHMRYLLLKGFWGFGVVWFWGDR